MSVGFKTKLESNTETSCKQTIHAGWYRLTDTLSTTDSNTQIHTLLYFVNSKAINPKGTSHSTCSFGKAYVVGILFPVIYSQ